MTAAIFATLLGLAALAWSADRFVSGASAVATHLGMAPLLVGMLVVGFGTSAPELVVSAFAAAGGNPEIALGNAMGSNIANIGLILGTTAILIPVIVHRGVLSREMPVLLGITLVLGLVMLDGSISRFDALVLLLVLGAQLAWSIGAGRRRRPGEPEDELAIEVEERERRAGMTRRAAWAWTLGGMALLVVASRLLVWGAVGIAERLGWSDLVIGLTVVAIGTSAPELAAAVAAARRRETELVLGNVIGSNIFNTLAVVGLAALISPMAVDQVAVTRDLPVLLVMTGALLLMGYRPGDHGRINRLEGGLLLAAWIAYTGALVLTAG
ncbi:calcium/sodium antiporter [Demequina sp. SYSU T00192]|uniref:Calcium/sodium antiporter n=1 Tax=Demequina litoralis TaxID=3051660 RepID=A0ABT8GBZ7_9MICO|nr:calcium/sodium antiporter [Demequina sp. SYSU T00192]MDN4476660.1 calcium/sodium antiporter [Demequina sp. SYSU T00192]